MRLCPARLAAPTHITDELKALLESRKGYVMTPEECEEQAISFAYGNLRLHDPLVTREGIALHAHCFNKGLRPTIELATKYLDAQNAA
ncbi:MAG: hypothetical protein JWN86_3600 [Planctomycetota bacterium]|nr:hypothetical protein [Planctomycetota bacterium]